MRALGILGGTFDPVHLGHIQSARELCERIGLESLSLMPCHLPPHRDRPQTASGHRLAMTKIAVAPWPRLTVDARELERDGPSYTVDTLRAVREEIGPGASLTFVMGSDAFNSLHQWHRWQGLFEFANILVMQREGYQLAPAAEVAEMVAAREQAAADLINERAGAYASIALSPWPQSATEVRARLAAGHSLGDCVPAEVEHYIEQHKLYRN